MGIVTLVVAVAFAYACGHERGKLEARVDFEEREKAWRISGGN